MEQSRERSSALPYTLVSKLLKREPSGHPRLRSPTLLYIYIYIYIYIYTWSIQYVSRLFCTGIWNFLRLLKIQYVIAIHLMRWLTNFYDLRLKWTATARIEIHPTKTWLSQLVNFKNAIWTSGHFRRTICNKTLFLSGIRDSRKAGSLRGMKRGVGGVRKSIHQSCLANGLGLGLLCWGFKGVQEEIPREEASTLQIGSVAFPPGQCTSRQFHPCHRLFEQDGHQDSSSPSL